MRTIIKNGTIVQSDGVFKADVMIEGEEIALISQSITENKEDCVIDANGKLVFPGGVDAHTHMANPHSADKFDSASIAAAVGGTTSMIVMTNSQKGQSLLDGVQDWKQRAATSVIDYGFHPTISGLHFTDSMVDELHMLVNEGITSIKMFMAYKGGSMVNDTIMYKVMKEAGKLGIISNIHAENGDLIDEMVKEFLKNGQTDPIYHVYSRPPIVEAEATARALAIAEATDAPVYIVHVSCSEALEQIERAKKRGIKVFAETCTHYLVLDKEYNNLPDFEGAKYVCSPPLRDKWQQDILWQGINSGLISTIGSDHSPYMFNGQKTEGLNNFAKIPNGVPGIEDRFSILYHFGVNNGRISLEKFVEIVCETPAKIFGMSKKGSIKVGNDADLVILDPQRSKLVTQSNQYQKSDYNLYEGMNIQGVITNVLSRGEVIVEEGRFIGELGRGLYLHRDKYINKPNTLIST